jgi:hypothetical protein
MMSAVRLVATISDPFRSRRLVVLLMGLAMSACSVHQGRHTSLGPTFHPLPPDQPVEVFRNGLPTRPFVRVSRLDVHVEKTDFREASFDEVVPELKNQARLSGANAIIEIQELRDWAMGTRTYHVTATGIRYLGQGES